MKKRVLITDVDNTLLDWQDLWYETFSAMIDKVLEISGVDSEELYAECSVIHQNTGRASIPVCWKSCRACVSSMAVKS